MVKADHEAQTGAYFGAWAQAGRAERMGESHAPLAAWCLEQLGPIAGRSILDLGCGAGLALAAARDGGAASLAGLDLSEDMLNLARARLPGADLRQGSMEALPWERGSVDLIISVEALYYAHDPGQALREMARVLKPGGAVAIAIDLYADNPGVETWPQTLPVLVHNWSAERWQQAARRAGFSEARAERIISREAPDPEAFEPSPWHPSYASAKAHAEAGALGLRLSRA